MQWFYTKMPVTIQNVKALEQYCDIQLPIGYKRILLSHHGARPKKKRFKTNTDTERVVKTFLPILDVYEANIYNMKERIQPLFQDPMVPFASTPSGDYLCFHYEWSKNKPDIILFHHEIQTFEKVDASFDQFLKSLY